MRDRIVPYYLFVVFLGGMLSSPQSLYCQVPPEHKEVRLPRKSDDEKQPFRFPLETKEIWRRYYYTLVARENRKLETIGAFVDVRPHAEGYPHQVILDLRRAKTNSKDLKLIDSIKIPYIYHVLGDGCSFDKRGLSRLLTYSDDITEMSFVGAKMPNRFLRPINKFTELMFLSLNNTPVGDRGIAHIRNPMLLRLELSGTTITNKSGATLGTIPQLDKLNVSNTAIGDGFLLHFRESSVSRLNLSNTQVTKDCVPMLMKLPKLRFVTFSKDQAACLALGRLKNTTISVLIQEDEKSTDK